MQTKNARAKKARARCLILGICLLPALACADQFDAVRESIRQHLQEQQVPGLSVAVWRDGKVLWEEGFGWADRENRIPATQHTMFNLASLSKTLTATGLITLVQAGKVDLDRPANDYLGPDTLRSRIGDPRAVTVRSLANHTSGMPAADQFFYGSEAAHVPSISDTIRRYGELMAPAGEGYRYSNLGYGVLGQLIARVSGRSYADYMRQEVFLPLGMTRSSMNLAPGLESYQAIRYDFDGQPIPFYVSAEPASASIYASAHDLASFGMFMLNNHRRGQKAILSDTNIAAMTAQPFEFRANRAYGVGLIISREGGYQLLSHSGSTSGVSSNFALVPEKNLGVVVLANADGGAGDVHTQILKTLLPQWRDAPPPASAATAPTFAPTPQLLGTWEGTVQTFEGEVPMRLRVLASGASVLIGKPRFANRSTFQQYASINEVAFKNEELTGQTLAQIETTDTKRLPHTVSLSLKLRDGVLSGSALAVSVFEGYWGYALPHWVELKKIAVEAGS